MIPVNEPLLGDRELENVVECVRSRWVSSSGRYIEEFEQRWASYCERRYGVAVSNGTAALQLAVASLGLEPGDEVIMPTFTIISCALALVYNGCVPVLVDAEPRTWCMDIDQVKDKITNKTKAIMVVHIYGHPVDMDPILELSERYGLAIIEDAAESHGAEYCSVKSKEQRAKHKSPNAMRSAPCAMPTTSSRAIWRKCGSFGDISCFSFYANKLVTTGEGGMVLTDDLQLAEKARSLRNLCFIPEQRFYHEELGFNFRMTNMQAALGVAQIERMDQIVGKKCWMGREYTSRLKDIRGLQLPVEEPWARSVYWMYGVVLSEETGINGEKFTEILNNYGIQTRPFFLGMHEQPIFKKRGLFLNEKYPVAEHLARQGVYLPSGLKLTEEQLGRVCDAVYKVLS